jgi:hypothetical protein
MDLSVTNHMSVINFLTNPDGEEEQTEVNACLVQAGLSPAPAAGLSDLYESARG